MKLLNTLKGIALLAVAGSFTLAFAACAGDTIIPVPADSSNALVIHASPNGPAVDFRLDDKVVYSVAASGATGIPYLGTTLATSNTGGYLNFLAGKRNVKVAVATIGTNPTPISVTTNDSAVVINADVTFEPNKYYSIFATDSVKKITPVIVEDNLSLPTTGKVKVRFAHMAVNAPAVDVAIKTVGTILFTNRSFKSVSDFIEVDPGAYALEVRPTGTTTVATTATVTLVSNKVYTVMARGFTSSLGATLITNR